MSKPITLEAVITIKDPQTHQLTHIAVQNADRSMITYRVEELGQDEFKSFLEHLTNQSNGLRISKEA